jgi:hypothetical protein
VEMPHATTVDWKTRWVRIPNSIALVEASKL